MDFGIFGGFIWLLLIFTGLDPSIVELLTSVIVVMSVVIFLLGLVINSPKTLTYGFVLILIVDIIITLPSLIVSNYWHSSLEIFGSILLILLAFTTLSLVLGVFIRTIYIKIFYK